MHCVTVIHFLRELFDFGAVHKETNVLTDATLFIDHSKAHAGIASLQICKDLSHGRTRTGYSILTARVGAEGAGDFDGDGHVKKAVGCRLEAVGQKNAET